MAKAGLHIDLLGTSFTITADEDRLYMESLLSHYRKVLSEVTASTGLRDPVKLSIITGIMLCDEAEKNSNPKGIDHRAVEELTLNLITRMDEVLEDTVTPTHSKP